MSSAACTPTLVSISAPSGSPAMAAMLVVACSRALAVGRGHDPAQRGQPARLTRPRRADPRPAQGGHRRTRPARRRFPDAVPVEVIIGFMSPG
jgi:hypothetical protein